MTLPNFLIVGAPKSGTTALYHYLCQHPSIFMSQEKEPHYFSYIQDRWPEWATQSLENYADLFLTAQTHTARGEASTWYLYSPTAAQEIHRTIPDTKIIALLRHPVDRAYSSFIFRQQCGWEDLSDFSDAIAQEPERIAQGLDWDYHYIQAGFYGMQLQRYYDRFPSSQIKVLLQEDLIAQPQQTIRSVIEFLGLQDEMSIDTNHRHNVTMHPKNKTINNFLAKPNSFKTALKKILPDAYRQAIANKIRTVNLKTPDKLDRNLRTRLVEVYREDIHLLQDLIHRDLSHWLESPNTLHQARQMGTLSTSV